MLADNGLKVTSAKDINRTMHITAQNKKGNSYVFREGTDFRIKDGKAYSTFNKSGNIVAPPKYIKTTSYDGADRTEEINSYMFWEKGIHSNDSNYNNIRIKIKPEVDKLITDNARRWGEIGMIFLPSGAAGTAGKVATGTKAAKTATTAGKVANSADDVIRGAGTATKINWNTGIKATQEFIAGTNIPKSFILSGKTINGKEIWVHGNATKHMGEYVNKANGSILVENELMNSFKTAVNKIIPEVGNEKRFFSNINGWEIGINGKTGVIYHALYKGGI